jgi:hypothetical protein
LPLPSPAPPLVPPVEELPELLVVVAVVLVGVVSVEVVVLVGVEVVDVEVELVVVDEVVVGVEVVEVLLVVVLLVRQSWGVSWASVLAPWARLARSLGSTVAGRFPTELPNEPTALAAAAHCPASRAFETWSS